MIRDATLAQWNFRNFLILSVFGRNDSHLWPSWLSFFGRPDSLFRQSWLSFSTVMTSFFGRHDSVFRSSWLHFRQFISGFRKFPEMWHLCMMQTVRQVWNINCGPPTLLNMNLEAETLFFPIRLWSIFKLQIGEECIAENREECV